MKNCTINVTTADTNDDEMPPLGTGGNVGLFRMRFGEEREGMRGWMNTALQARRAGTGRRWVPAGSAWVMLPIIIKPLDLGGLRRSPSPSSPPNTAKGLILMLMSGLEAGKK